MKKRLKLLIPAACLILAGASFGVTYAYLTASDSAVNEFSVGENEIDIIEDSYVPPEKLEPGISFNKNPCVANTGELPCFVRMRADFSDSDAEKFCVLVYGETDGYNEVDWEYNEEDGYYYYKYILEPGEQTNPLFDTVKIKEEYDENSSVQEKDMIDFDIMIYAESCQHVEHDGNDHSGEYLTVWKGEDKA